MQKECLADPDNHINLNDATDGPAPVLGGLSSLDVNADNENDRDKILFKDDRLYQHRIFRINYTTYDVRRGQDVINPSTSHRNIMVLADHGGSSDTSIHRFIYGRVLGIYHANVFYTGTSMHDFQPRRVEFLWVRWYAHSSNSPNSWNSYKLNHLTFPPMADDGSFGFLDPSDVLRGCHILPRFHAGKRYRDGIGLSRITKDANDYHSYFQNR